MLKGAITPPATKIVTQAPIALILGARKHLTTPFSSHIRVRFAAISVLRFISDFYLESTNKLEGGAFQNIPYGDNGLRHVMTAEVSQCQLTILVGLPHGFP